METSEECLGSDPCLGDPNNPNMGDCMFSGLDHSQPKPYAFGIRFGLKKLI